MKINEVFANLIKNSNNDYELLKGGFRYVLFMDERGYIILHSYLEGKLVPSLGSGGFSGNFKLTDEWKLIHKPVPWQKAIEAYSNDHKNLEIIWDNKLFVQSSDFPLGVFENTPLGLTPILFAEGKWYITEGD